MDVDGRQHVDWRLPGRKEQDGRSQPRKGLWRRCRNEEHKRLIIHAQR